MCSLGTLCFVGCCLAAYLLGSVPFGYLMGRLRGVDIREGGSRNIGATNCWRLCGWTCGLPAFLLDVAKGFAVTFGAGLLLGACPLYDQMSRPTTYLLVIIAGAAVILGHVFPLYLHFRGGKAVATSLGVFLGIPALLPLAGGAFALWLVVFAATRYVSVASTAAALGLLVGVLLADFSDGVAVNALTPWTERWPLTSFTILLVAVVLYRHRTNYSRLLAGTENKFGRKKEDSDNTAT
jgi:glycerol-3-phosphate acyltransferase PlsY